MQTITPKTQIIIGNVPWDNTYNHVVDFSNATEQQSAISKHLRARSHIEYKNFNIIRETFDLIIPDNYEKFRNYGYCMFTNPDLLNGVWLYAFISKIEFVSVNATRLIIELDEWQNHHLTLVLKPSFVNRMHIPKNQDVVGRWLAKEPFSVKGEIFRQIDEMPVDDFTPQIEVNSLSNPIKIGNDITYEYGGFGNYPEEFTLIYGRFVSSSTQLQELLKEYIPDSIFEGTIDHRNDIIGVTAIPYWVYRQLFVKGAILPDVPVEGVISKNITVEKSYNFALNSSLACNYTPKNKKMLTSMCKTYILFNKNNFQATFKPENFNRSETTVDIVLSAKGLNSSTISCKITNYGKLANIDGIPPTANYLIPYNFSYMVGYNQNAGSVKTLNQISSIFRTGDNLLNSMSSIADAKSLTGLSKGLLGLGDSVISGVTEIANANSDFTGSIGGNSSDTLCNSAEWNHLIWADISPKIDECKQIDDYLSAYGYAIEEVIQPSFKTRSNWNYLQIQNPAFSVNAPSESRTLFASMLSNGITVWHNINNMNNYSLDNN